MSDLEVKVTVTVIEGLDQGASIQMQKSKITIGRRKADLILTDKKVSNLHAAIGISGREVVIEDLESRNGVLVNGKKVERTILFNLDEVELGLTKLKVFIVDDLATFKNRNLSHLSEGEDFNEASEDDDIASMIDDELSRFSKWDLASSPESIPLGRLHSGFAYGIEVLKGPDIGKKVWLEKEFSTLGRGDSDIAFRDGDVSRLHAVIEVIAKGRVVIRDLGSTNGTWVNRRKIVETELHHNDRIQVGGTLCKFVLEAS